MYKYHNDGASHYFDTSNGTRYKMYFAIVNPSEFYAYFNFPLNEFHFIRDESTRRKRSGIDFEIKETVNHFLQSYFKRNPNSVLLCEYSDMNGSNIARHRLFSNWFALPINQYRFESTSINGFFVTLIIPINSIYYNQADNLLEELKSLPD